MDISNRWGESVFHTKDINVGWNERVGNQEYTKQDVFVRKIIAKDLYGKQHVFVGHVTLTK